jgi:hypothetical protein
MTPFGPAEVVGHVTTGFQCFFMRKDALTRFGDTREDFLQSFVAAAICLPAFLWLFWIGRAAEEDQLFADVAPLYRLVTHSITHVIDWVYWPLIMFYVCDMMNKSDRWIRYVVATNWTVVTPYLGFVVLSFLTGAGDGSLVGGIAFGLQIWVFAVQAWLLRVVVGTPMPLTVGLVIGNFMLGGLVLLESQRIVMLAG